MREGVEVVEDMKGFGVASLGMGLPLDWSVVMLLEVDTIGGQYQIAAVVVNVERRRLEPRAR